MAWWNLDFTTGKVTFNKRKSEMLGYPPEKFTHYTDFMDLVHADDHIKAMNAMREHMDGILNKYSVEYRIKTKSGKYKWFFDTGSIVKRDSNGLPVKATGLVFDISKQKETEKALSILQNRDGNNTKNNKLISKNEPK